MKPAASVALRVLLGASALVALTACLSDEAPATGFDEAEQASCLAEGGRYEIAGLLQAYTCLRPTPDAGKACTTGADCDGLCLSDSMTCSSERPLFGCHGMITEDGQDVVICID